MVEKKALMTGATGFVGSNLARLLVADGWRVSIIIRDGSDLSPLAGAKESILPLVHDGSTASMQAIMSEVRPDVVFHLASLFLSEHRSEDIEALVRSNLLFGTQLAEAAAREQVRFFLNTGTSWQHYMNEAYNPVNLYAATKQAFQDILAYYVEARGLKVITLKLYDTFGPGDPRPKLMNLLKRIAQENTPLAMSPGGQCIDMVHVDDVVEAFIAAARRLMDGKVSGHEHYGVSSGSAVRLRDFVGLVEQVLGRELPIRWGERKYREREVMELWRGEVLPGWRPKKDLKKAIAEYFSDQISR